MPRRAKQATFDPQSLDAQFATLIAEQKAHREEMRTCFASVNGELVAVREQTTRTNGRVGNLEVWRETSKAKLAGIATTLGLVGGGLAWCVQVLLGR